MTAPAIVTLFRHSGGRITYTISDPDRSGVAQVTLEVLVELLTAAGYQPEVGG